MTKGTFLLLAVCLILSTQCCCISAADSFYVTPNNNTPCPRHLLIFPSQCFTLSEYSTDPNHFGSSTDIELIFLPGSHNLTSNFVFGGQYIQINSSEFGDNVDYNVVCTEEAKFVFQGVSNVSISDIQFSGCGGNFSLVTQLTIERCAFNGLNQNGSGLDLRTITDATIIDSTFVSNANGQANDPFSMDAISAGGAIVIHDSFVQISNTTFDSNFARQGGAIFSLGSEILIEQCIFINNTALLGGAIYDGYTTLRVTGSNFTNNSAIGDRAFGGAMELLLNGTVFISDCVFIGNSASFGGGAIDFFRTNGINISDSHFYGNEANIGSALYVEIDNMLSTSLTFINNTATTSVIHIIQSAVTIGGNTTVSNNVGSVFSFASNVTFSGYTYFLENLHPKASQMTQQEGGAVTCFQSEIFFVDTTFFSNNNAKIGGAISAKETKIYMYGEIKLSNNTATLNGGGIFLYRSEITFNGTAEIFNNSALNGGGLHSVSSTINVIDGSVWIAYNSAGESGGAMYFEQSAKLYIVKYRSECTDHILCNNMDNDTWIRLEIAHNTAEYGGAVYIDDYTESGTCKSIPYRAQFTSSECFFQTLDLHSITLPNLNLVNIYFFNNSASSGGDTIYGGLLDRCRVSSFAEIFRLIKYADLSPVNINAMSYLLNVTNIQRKDIQQQVGSDPLRICFCNDSNQPDCDFQPSNILARKGGSITISLVAVDQVNNTVPNSLIAAILADVAELNDGQSFQTTSDSGACSNLLYNVYSSGKDNDVLSLFPTGPCNDNGISERFVNISFLPCPAGFVSTGRECTCDDTLSPNLITNCSVDTGLVIRVGNVWVSVINATAEEKEYISYPNCPFDYCRPSDEKIYINLGDENGSDVLCALNRTGKLCGACDRSKNLSHAFGGSRCLPCSYDSLALFIPFILAGIALVGFILLCNLTVAIGSIDALIFYANIVGVNRAHLLPFKRANFFSIFIAWLNLDFGFETCFFDGLDEYAKVWLQFVYPTYIIFLVAMVIIISKYSNSFATLLSKRNPIATLATLILLSFTKLVRVVIAALSFVRLDVQVNGTVDGVKVVWLVDGNVPYLEGKHIPLFLSALVVFMIVLAYVLLLFSWQWLLRCPNKKILRWIRDVRLNSFMDAYNAPFTRRHRYWTGLLLIARGILYLISALFIFGDPQTPLFAIVLVVAGLLVLKEIIKRRIYKKKFLNVLEGIFHCNLLVFASATLYLGENSESQIPLAYASTAIAFILFIFILIYHTYTFLLKDSIPVQKFFNSYKSRRQSKHKTDTATLTDSRTVALLSEESDCDEYGRQQDFSKFRGPLELLDTQSFSESLSSPQSDLYTPPGSNPTVNGNPHRVARVTYSVVDPIPSENDINDTMEQSLTQM